MIEAILLILVVASVLGPKISLFALVGVGLGAAFLISDAFRVLFISLSFALVAFLMYL